jgi:predicted DNA-binding transcriptional regulator AlpA
LAKKQVFLTRADLRTRGITYSANYLRELVKKERFPAPHKLSERKVVWDESAIDAWLRSRISKGVNP